MSLSINIIYEDDMNSWIVKPAGEIDIYTSPDFKEEVIKKYKENKTNIIIDGSSLDYIDSTGLGALISIYKDIKKDENKIYLQNIKPNIRKLLDITDLDKIFVIKE